MAIKECIKCGLEFYAKGKRKLCIPCSESDDLGSWQSTYYNKNSPIVSNIDIAESIDNGVAVIECKYCGKLFNHYFKKIDSKTVFPIYCENGCRNEYKRREDTITIKDEPNYNIAKIVEYSEAFNCTVITAIRHFVGNANDIDIRIFDEVYHYLKRTRGKNYFKKFDF